MSSNAAPTLKAGGIGLLGAATLGTVMLSPAMTIYGSFGPSYLGAGHAAPLAFVLALLATLPTAASYALLSRDYPDAGSAASWIGRAGSRWIAEWAGWMVFLYYFDNFTIQPVTMGVFLNDILTTAGFNAGTLTYAAGVLLCCLLAGWIVYRGISPSIHGALAFLSFETLVVAALCLSAVYFAFKTGASLDLGGFTPSTSLKGTGGLFQAMIFGMLAFCGFDVISTLSEETHMARTLIPRATFLSLMIYGIFIVAGVWALTYSGSVAEIQAFADRGGMPITGIARKFWGAWSVLIPFTALSAALGISIATSIGASRVLYSSARAGTAPGIFAKLHGAHLVPWNALHVIFAGGFILAVASGAWLGPYKSYVWWATTSTYFAMLTYLIVNAANLFLFRQRALDNFQNLFLHVAVPLAGICFDLVILYQSFFLELWRQDWATGKSIVVFDVGCTAISLTAALRYFTRRAVPDKLELGLARRTL